MDCNLQGTMILFIESRDWASTLLDGWQGLSLEKLAPSTISFSFF